MNEVTEAYHSKYHDREGDAGRAEGRRTCQRNRYVTFDLRL